MPSSKSVGMDRSHQASRIQKWTFAIIHLLIVLTCTWLVYFDGWTSIGNLFDKHWQLADPTRASVLLFCAVLYWLRHLITLFYLLVRKVSWGEVFGLLIFFALFEIGLVLIGGGAFQDHAVDLSGFDIVALSLLVIGSFVNSFSEMQRKWWKADSVNKGHCYTEGLFRHSLHINFFGDLVLFSGWCLLTTYFWTLGLPLFMAALFIFFHIPSLDKYLANRYGDEFKSYEKRTKKLIPFIY